MSSIPFDLSKIRAFVPRYGRGSECYGEPHWPRWYAYAYGQCQGQASAMQYAVKQGYTLAVISGGASEAMTQRFHQLGAKHVYMRVSDKAAQLDILCREAGITPDQIAYIGDDIPDIPIMKLVALPCAPADAAPEVKSIATYISLCDGGYGVVRDVIEQTLRANGQWSLSAGFGW